MSTDNNNIEEQSVEQIVAQIENRIKEEQSNKQQVKELLEDVNNSEANPNDILDIENRLVGSNGNSNGKKGKTKAELVDAILDTGMKQGVETKKEHQLKRMTKPELEKILASMIDDGLNELNQNTDKIICEESGLNYEEYKKQVKSGEPLGVVQSVGNLSIDVGAQALFNINKLFATALEKFNENVAVKHTDISIEGYSDNLDSKKEELLRYYASLYSEYASQLQPYLNPVNMILLINMQSVIASAHQASEKKSVKE